MLRKIDLVLLLSLALLLSFGVFVRGDLFGFDGYASWDCVKGDCSFLSSQPLAVMVFSFLPDSLLVFKLVMFLSLFSSLVALFFVGKRFFDANVVWVSLLLVSGLSPLLVFVFGQFENELFAFPLLFWGFYFVLSNKASVKCLSLPLFAIALFFWGGTAYFMLILVPLYLILALPLFFIIILNLDMFINYLTPSQVMESRLFSGFFALFGLIVIIPFFFKHKNKMLWISFIFCIALVGLQGKFTPLLIPFFIISAGHFYLFLEKKGFTNLNIVLLCLFLIVGWNIALVMQQPTSQDWEIVEEAVLLQKDLNIPLYNDWSFGHWIKHKGYDTKNKGGFPNPDYNTLPRPFIALTQEDLICEKIKDYSNALRSSKLFICR